MAVRQHSELFGKAPRGLWPSEGSIAPELVPLMQAAGIQYFCSDEENLFRSLERDPAFVKVRVDHLEMFQGWSVEHDGARVQAIFREKPLSDFIGFMAAKNRPEDAAGHLLFHLRNIARVLPKGGGVIPLILDGENAWETFADGGRGFLRALYSGMLEEKSLQTTTIEGYLAQEPPSRTVRLLHTGSWISSDFDIWIGEEEENRAWDVLGDTRSFLQTQIDSGSLAPEQKKGAILEIYAAEGSDWFWWYGPDFSTENDALFDELFRQHLKNVYHICGALPPARLEDPITAKRGAPLYTLPERPVSRELTGRRFSYFDWVGAGCYVAGSEQGAMYRSGRLLKQFFFGNDIEFLYFRLDPVRNAEASVKIEFHGPKSGVLELESLQTPGLGSYVWEFSDGVRTEYCGRASREVVELEIPLAFLEPDSERHVRFQVKVFEGGLERECYPERVPIEFKLTQREYALENWSV
jgi:hypothetical protein